MSLGLGSDLGKRKNRWEEEGGGGVMSAGPGCESFHLLFRTNPTFYATLIDVDFRTFLLSVGAIKKRKVYVPVREHPDVNFLGTVITQHIYLAD
jgi:hypothetical protein